MAPARPRRSKRDKVNNPPIKKNQKTKLSNRNSASVICTGATSSTLEAKKIKNGNEAQTHKAGVNSTSVTAAAAAVISRTATAATRKSTRNRRKPTIHDPTSYSNSRSSTPPLDNNIIDGKTHSSSHGNDDRHCLENVPMERMMKVETTSETLSRLKNICILMSERKNIENTTIASATSEAPNDNSENVSSMQKMKGSIRRKRSAASKQCKNKKEETTKTATSAASSLILREDGEEFLFPPTVFTDATYRNGILIANPAYVSSSSCKTNNFATAGTSAKPKSKAKRSRKSSKDTAGTKEIKEADKNEKVYKWDNLYQRYFANDREFYGGHFPSSSIALLYHLQRQQQLGFRSHFSSSTSTNTDKSKIAVGDLNMPNARRFLPILKEEEGKMWCHKHAALTAAARRFPFESVRLLGCITLNFEEEILDEKASSSSAAASSSAKPKRARGKPKKVITEEKEEHEENEDEKKLKIGPWAEERSDEEDDYRYFGGITGTFIKLPWKRYACSKVTRIHRKISRKMALAEAEAEYNILLQNDDDEDIRTGKQNNILNGMTKKEWINSRSDEIFTLWTTVQSSKPRQECWSKDHGGFSRDALRDKTPSVLGEEPPQHPRAPNVHEHHVSLSTLHRWIKNGKNGYKEEEETVFHPISGITESALAASVFEASGVVETDENGDKRTIYTFHPKGNSKNKNKSKPQKKRVPMLKDLNEGKTVDLYNGIRKIPIDATSVLEALIDLSNPVGLYNIPLLVPYAVAELVSPSLDDDVKPSPSKRRNRKAPLSKKNPNTRLWRIRIGIYMNRLLPEILTCHHLHVIMSALDHSSYRITQALHLPPQRDPNDPVFASANFPEIDMNFQKDAVVLESPRNATNGYRMEEYARGRGVREGESVVIWENRNGIRAIRRFPPIPTAAFANDANNNDGETDLTPIDVEEDEGVAGMGNNATRDEKLISPFTVRGLLKLLENKGNDVSNWPAIEKILAPRLRLNLLLHQKHAICWMIQMESLRGFGINSILWEEREFFDGGKYYYSPALGQIRLGKPPNMKGGILCDEMGLGKTIEVLGLILVTIEDLKQEAIAENEVMKQEWDSTNCKDDLEEWCPQSTHTTLIIVPPALVWQWLNEIKKASGDSLKVVLLHAKTGEIIHGNANDNDPLDSILQSDIVISTYEALVNKKTSKTLSSIRWGRIVLDEMQEIRSSTTQISRNCEMLQCSRRWMLSGTPLFDNGIEDLCGELNFLRLEPYGAKFEDGFLKFSITNHWEAKSKHALEILQILGMLMLRRAKDMTVVESGLPILGLKPITIEYVPVLQSESERALYCWMEYLVSQELKCGENSKDSSSRGLCLRLLRELCVTPVLLNGGMGVSSQLSAVNRLMINLNRRLEAMELSSRRHTSSHSKISSNVRVLSCDRALRFLTQVQHSMRTSDDFVSDVSFGGGGGVTNRVIAHDSAEKKYADAEKEVGEAMREMADAKSKRAKLRWHFALEKVTTGQISKHGAGSGCYLQDITKLSRKWASLWSWRFVTQSLQEQHRDENGNNVGLPSLLSRGWRPSPSFLRCDLYASHPEFSWAHPISLLVNKIPCLATEEELQDSIYEVALQVPQARKVRDSLVKQLKRGLDSCDNNCTKAGDNEQDYLHDAISKLRLDLDNAEEELKNAVRHDENMKKAKVFKSPSTTNTSDGTEYWKAVMHFSDEEDVKNVILSSSKINGIALKCKQTIPHIEAAKEAAYETLCLMESANKVHPSRTNQLNEAEARKNLAQAKLGLRIFVDPKFSDGHVILSKPVGPFRPLLPRTTSALIESTTRTKNKIDEKLVAAENSIGRGKQVLDRLVSALKRNVSEEIVQTSAFGILEALSNNEVEKTQCPICLCPLGAGRASSVPDKAKTEGDEDPLISMINCGHFFCIKCLDQYTHQKIASNQATTCPNCRRPFSIVRDVVHVNHRLQGEREALELERKAAKKIVQKASKMLEESNGQLDTKMWRSLFLAFDLPSGVSTQAHPIFTAIPREVLTHLRKATNMAIHCNRNDGLGGNSQAGRSSKINALLADLPRSERSVVFTSTKYCVKHLMAILKEEEIGCRALYIGQASFASEQAVSEWESGDNHGPDNRKALPYPVLLVQAGAAASGLTLTAASKMFLMEPFTRQEEEQQAYARCHRFGQINEVNVKCYFTPVSVESRLLEWRRRAQSQDQGLPFDGSSNTKVIMRDIQISGEDNGHDEKKMDSEVNECLTSTNEDVDQSMFLLGL